MGNYLSSPFLRKLNLTAHVAFSVGWFGSVAFFLLLAIRGLTTKDGDTQMAMYVAMEVGALTVIVPACLGSLVTGINQSLGTHWGLFKHYWISTKLVLSVFGTLLLLVHLEPIGVMASVVTSSKFVVADRYDIQFRLVVDAIAASAILMFALALSVYKPWGRIDLSRLRSSRRSIQIILALLSIAVIAHTLLRH